MVALSAQMPAGNARMAAMNSHSVAKLPSCWRLILVVAGVAAFARRVGLL